MSQPVKAEETPTTPYTQWTANRQYMEIPIDPALQQQSQTPQPAPTYQYSPYTHYQQYHYQYAPAATTSQPVVQAPVVASPAPSRPATTPAATAQSGSSNDINTLKDALGSAGVDLRAEEETLQRTSDHHLTYRPYEDRTRKQPAVPSIPTPYLSTRISTICTSHALPRSAPDDTINYLALALRARLTDLLTSMIKAAKHRTDAQFDRPASLYDDGSAMWSILVRSDVGKQLAVLEKVEREEELRIRRERKERADMAAAHAAALAAQAAANNPSAASSANPNGDGFDDGEGASGGSKKKRKKDGPGVTARNMSADVQKKMSNAVASQAAGLGGRYAWMTAANATAPPPKKSVAPATPAAATATTAAAAAGGASSPTLGASAPAGTSSTTATATTPAGGSSWARPYVSSAKKTTAAEATPEVMEEDGRTAVTMRDAMFVIRNERGHGGGRGAARGWT